VAGRRSVWSAPAVQELAASFVPAADEAHFLKVMRGAEGDLFRAVAEKGHYAGRTVPTSTRQGIYAFARSGAFLASINTRSAEHVAAMLDEALAKWAELPTRERYMSERELAAHRGWRWESQYPADGLVLRAHSRELPRDDAPDDWRAEASNREYAWFRADELGGWLPTSLAPGAEREVAAPLVERLLRHDLIDNVRGQVPPFPPEAVERAELTVRVTAVDGERVELELAGATRAVMRGRWAIAGHRDRDDPSEQERGVETALLGSATWDAGRGAFTAFELVALGRRWGAGQYNARTDDLEPTGIGFVFVLAGPRERVAPASVWSYGWED
jgi:hypothetical protein